MSLLHVLLTEENDAIRPWLSLALRPRPCIIVEASGGADLERRLLGHERFDLVITDVALQGPSGLEVAVRARRAGVQTPIIFMTGHQDEPMATAVRGLGSAVLLPKPVEGEELVAHIRRWLVGDSG